MVVRLSAFDSSSQIQLVRLQHETFFGNRVPTEPIRPVHVEDNFLVDQQFVVETKVVAVRVNLLLTERVNHDVAFFAFLLNRTASQDHA